MNTAIRAIVVGLVLCMASVAAAQTVLVTASGQVDVVSDPDRYLPGSIRPGSEVSAVVRYEADQATGGPFSDNRALYEFPARIMRMSMTIDGRTWTCSNILSGRVSVDNDVPGKDVDYFVLSVEDDAGQFPYAVPQNRGTLVVGFRDVTPPLDMVQSLVLPTVPQHVNFREATDLYGDLYSQNANGQIWHIAMRFSDAALNSTVSVQESTWGAVKRLYD